MAKPEFREKVITPAEVEAYLEQVGESARHAFGLAYIVAVEIALGNQPPKVLDEFLDSLEPNTADLLTTGVFDSDRISLVAVARQRAQKAITHKAA